MLDQGSKIWDPGSGKGKSPDQGSRINIPDPQLSILSWKLSANFVRLNFVSRTIGSRENYLQKYKLCEFELIKCIFREYNLLEYDLLEYDHCEYVLF